MLHFLLVAVIALTSFAGGPTFASEHQGAPAILRSHASEDRWMEDLLLRFHGPGSGPAFEAELRKEGFVVADKGGEAHYSWGVSPCREQVTIHWRQSANDARLIHVDADRAHEAACM